MVWLFLFFLDFPGLYPTHILVCLRAPISFGTRTVGQDGYFAVKSPRVLLGSRTGQATILSRLVSYSLLMVGGFSSSVTFEGLRDVYFWGTIMGLH